MTGFKVILGALIIVLVWVSNDTWSKVLITIAAALIMIFGAYYGYCCKEEMPKNIMKSAPAKKKKR